MSKFSKTVGPRTHSGSGNASGWQTNDDASHMKGSNMASEGARQQGILTPDEVDQQIRRFLESDRP
jgi:hypothetical protein